MGNPELRVALIMSGQLRSIAALQQSHSIAMSRYRRKHDVSLFVHAWLQDDDNDSHFKALEALQPETVSLEVAPVVQRENLLLPGLNDDPADNGIAERFALMWSSVHEGYKLMLAAEAAHGRHFDLVARVRPDIAVNLAPSLRADLPRPTFPRRHAAMMEPSDLCFVSPRRTADAIFSLHGHLPTFKSDYAAYGYPRIVPEFVLGYYLGWSGIEWDQMDTDVVLVRESGSVLWFDQDPDSFALKAGLGVHIEPGDGLPYNSSAKTSADRTAEDVRWNTGLTVDGGQALALLSASKRGDLDAIYKSSIVRARSRGWLGSLYASRVAALGLANAHAQIGNQVFGVAIRHPLRSASWFVLLSLAAVRRVSRRARVSRSLGLSVGRARVRSTPSRSGGVAS